MTVWQDTSLEPMPMELVVSGCALLRRGCFPFLACLGRESHKLWLGTVHTVQSTFVSKGRHLIRFHSQPYCLGGIERHA